MTNRVATLIQMCFIGVVSDAVLLPRWRIQMNTNLTLADQYAILDLGIKEDTKSLKALKEAVVETGSAHLEGDMYDLSIHLRAKKVIDEELLFKTHGVTVKDIEALETLLKSYKSCTKDDLEMTTVVTVKAKLALAA